MKTKQDLLDRMSALAACCEATTWVTSQEGTALEIGLRSDRIDWFVWLIGRIDPLAIADFARRCADRAETYATAYADAARAAAAATAYADATAAAATAYAFSAADADRADAAHAYADAVYAAAYAAARAANAAADDDAERRTQLTDLRALWIEITKGV